jgi:glycosyltransferase involved in cell wall biosynthesis
VSRRIRVRAQLTRYGHWAQHSGIAQYIRHLDPKRFRASCYYASDSDDDLPLPGEDRRRRLSEKVRSNGMAWYKLSDLAGEMRAFAASALGRADIVHFLDAEHGGQYLPGWFDRFPVRRAKMAVSYHQPPELLPELVNGEVAARFDRVVVVSPTQRAYFERFMPAEKIVTILHGIDTDFYRPASLAPDGIFRCVSAGHWLRDWGTVRAVAEQFASRPDVEFHIVTNRETGLEDLSNVHFHRDVPDEKLRAVYQRGDVLLLPLTGSTANNSLLEGLACGLPVVSTDLASVRTYVGQNAALLLPSGDVQGVVDAVETLRADGALRERLAQGSRARAEELSWQRITRDYEALYRDMLKS